MKKKACMILAALLCVFVIFSGGCAIEDFSEQDTYEGLPIYQFNTEDQTVVIDGIVYRQVDDIIPKKTVVGERIGYMWYKPHFEIEQGVLYGVNLLSGFEDGEYLYATSYTVYKIGKASRKYRMILERAY